MPDFKKLFETNYIGTMRLKNRICFGEVAPQAKPMGGAVTQVSEDFYVARARGGCALVMVGGTTVDPSGLGSKTMCLLDDDKYIPALAKLAAAVHAASPGVKVGVQISHLGRQMYPDAIDAPPGMKPVAPSAIQFEFGVTPHELTVAEIEHLVEQFVEGARRVQDAGFDCVEVHGAHGYLISSLMSRYTNRRTDRYGGSIENNARFACEVIEGIKKRCGKDFPVLIKINGDDYIDDEGHITPDYAAAMTPFFERAGVDEIHISGGQHESPFPAGVSPYYIPKAPFADQAALVKKQVKIPVGAMNRIDGPELAEELLEAGKIDLAWMLRALVCDPELPNKTAAGRLDEIRPCIACNVCLDLLSQGFVHEYRCAVNSEAWREGVAHVEPSLRTKKVLVVGGGPAGMEAARLGALIGHDVTLWEKDGKLGGQLNLAAVPPGKGEITRLVRYYSAELANLGVNVELGKEATPALVKELQPDVIIIASGSHTSLPPIPGIDGPNVADARDILAGKRTAGEKVVVVGGGEAGMETAELLASQGKKVTLVEMLPTIGDQMVRGVFSYVSEQLVKLGVEVLTSARVEEITGDSLRVVDHDGLKRTLEVDTVVIATGAKPNSQVQDELQGLAREVYLAGDCLTPGDIRAAIHQGNMIGRMLY